MAKRINKLALARECLRQIWQIFDAGGHSMGRSMESFLLEAAMEFIEGDYRYSSLADKDPRAFHDLVRECLWRVNQKANLKRDKELGYK